jgi:hypothetical protein
MPRYFFDVRLSDRTDEDAHGAVLPNDGAALIYANRVIGKLKEDGGYADPDLQIIVRKEAGGNTVSIAFD